MATTITVNGYTTSVPGAFTKIDVSGLDPVGLSEKGLVALVGTAVGGRPAFAGMKPSEFIRVNSPARAKEAFASGDLLEAALMAFNPSADAQIQGGATSIVCMKVNDATQASRTFSNSDGTVMTVTSAGYGELANATAIEHLDGTAVDTKAVTVALNDASESGDNLGEDPIFSLVYNEPTGDGGWNAVRAQILNGGTLRVSGRRRDVGLDTDITAQPTSALPLTVVSASALDDGALFPVTIYGLDNSNLPISETIFLDGTTPAAGLKAFKNVYGITKPATTGIVTIKDTFGAPVTILAMAALAEEAGLKRPSAMFANGKLNLVGNPIAGSCVVLLWGTNAAGDVIFEKVTLAAADTYVQTANDYAKIDVIVLGNVSDAAPDYVAITGTVLQTSPTLHNDVTKAKTYVNSRQVPNSPDPYGFTMEVLTGATTFAMADLDLSHEAAPTGADVTLINPIGANVHTTWWEFSALLKSMLDFYNLSSSLASATKIAFVAKSSTVAWTTNDATTYSLLLDGVSISYLSDGTATTDEIQDALIALINKDHRLNQRVLASTNTNTPTTGSILLTALTPAGFATATPSNVTITAVNASAGTGYPPSNTTTPEFLTGGSEGTFNDWELAIDLLRQIRVNTIVPLTGDPAVHAYLAAHCESMAGPGKSERDMIVGLSALSGSTPLNTLPTKTSIKSQIRDLNTRHSRACAQSIEYYDSTGERSTFLPWFQAAMAAGLQAASPIGLPATHKFFKALDINQDPSWNPADDGDEMIRGGLWFMESIDVGVRNVRNVTTWLKSNNLAYIEASVNEVVNFVAYDLRQELETAVGQVGTVETVTGLKTRAQVKLNIYVSNGIIVDWQALTFNLVGDTLNVAVQISPVVGINFVVATLHLKMPTLSA